MQFYIYIQKKFPHMINILLQLIISSAVLIPLNYKLLLIVVLLIPITIVVTYLFLNL